MNTSSTKEQMFKKLHTASLNVRCLFPICSFPSLHLSLLAYSEVLTEVSIHNLSVKALTEAR